MATSGLAGLALAAMLVSGAPAWAEKSAPHEISRAELLRRAKAGDIKAYDLLANSYLDAKGDLRDVEAAVRWLKIGVKAGDTDCMIDLGNLYYDGADLNQDPDQALSLYVAAAAKGDALGAYNAGLVYETSADDIAQAVSWYRRAAAGGDEGGMYKVALAYQLGRGAPSDSTQAVAWMRMAARAGSADATNDLGEYYAQGYGVAADPVQALKFYREAVRLGSAVAMANVGSAYHDGEGVTADFQEARSWYVMAANNGDVTAYYELGQMYEDGEGVKTSAAKAVELYRAAAESDDDDVAQAAEDAIERLEGGSSTTPTA
ncbi:tetratricopeptide repeat protein [Caulobacter soli]|uniref:tetratricopeptide repeat protein n=1 Tax=Caulobacter soli TaxID=2708539 RepID=UPI0013EBB508|nr:tetratricopeptide repeat protein [Caulobacter soli]